MLYEFFVRLGLEIPSVLQFNTVQMVVRPYTIHNEGVHYGHMEQDTVA